MNNLKAHDISYGSEKISALKQWTEIKEKIIQRLYTATRNREKRGRVGG